MAPKNKYSFFSIAKNALTFHENWQKTWKSPEPKKNYEAIIVGGGGHGLTTAYYLAKNHGIKNIAVIEKGWIGGGNTGRNTTIIRSNYLWDQSAALYEHALKLWEGMSQELNYNVMFSQRGVLNVAHNLHDVRELKRRWHANRLNDIDCEWLDTKKVKEFCQLSIHHQILDTLYLEQHFNEELEQRDMMPLLGDMLEVQMKWVLILFKIVKLLVSILKMEI